MLSPPAMLMLALLLRCRTEAASGVSLLGCRFVASDTEGRPASTSCSRFTASFQACTTSSAAFAMAESPDFASLRTCVKVARALKGCFVPRHRHWEQLVAPPKHHLQYLWVQSVTMRKMPASTEGKVECKRSQAPRGGRGGSTFLPAPVLSRRLVVTLHRASCRMPSTLRSRSPEFTASKTLETSLTSAGPSTAVFASACILGMCSRRWHSQTGTVRWLENALMIETLSSRFK